MNTNEMTPVEVDTEIARINGLRNGFFRQISQLSEEIDRCISDARQFSYYSREEGMLRRYTDKIADFRIEVAKLDEEAAPFHAEFNARQWTRFFLVEHVHSNQHCSSFRWNTQIGWLPEFSGQSEDELVNKIGEMACTICYPSAPVEKKSEIDFYPERTAARLERERKAAEKAAKAAAASITFEDGSVVMDELPGSRWARPIKTERSAQIAAVDAYAYGVSSVNTDYAAEKMAFFEYILPALAFKSGVSIEVKRAELVKKGEKKRW